MFFVYILKSIDYNWHYIGSCEDISRRFKRHNRKLVRSTKAYAPFKLIYFEEYETGAFAFNREMFLKSKNGISEKLKILNSLER